MSRCIINNLIAIEKAAKEVRRYDSELIVSFIYDFLLVFIHWVKVEAQ